MPWISSHGREFPSSPTQDIPPQTCPSRIGACTRLGPGAPFSLWPLPTGIGARFYEKMIRSILNGGWDAPERRAQRAGGELLVGHEQRVVDVRIDPSLPDGVQHLAEILKRGIVDGSIDPFHRLISSQDGALRNDGNQWYSPEEILHMDWLCDCVEGSIPPLTSCCPCPRPWSGSKGVYRDRIPPERRGTLL